MNERPGRHLSRLDIDLARRIDAICRRFEADWRAGKSPVIGDYLVEVDDEGRPALRDELEALERELRGADETKARSDSGPIAEAPTIAPASPPTELIPVLARPSVHEEATVVPGDPATVDLGSSGPVPPEAPATDRVRYFGDYEVVRELARGGMGVVFLARQVSLNRPVALKMILTGQLADDTDVKRFYTEAEAAGNLDHPGIVPIYEVGQHEGQHYFSMGFVEGQSLSQKLAEGPLPPREAAALMIKVAEAIEYAHQRGVIHRDLKPGNILLDRSGNPRVTDFGLAKRLQSDSGLTGSGQIMGTPSYMPPEQAGGERGLVGPAADVYALGATLYALVTGRPPFQAATAMDTVLQVIGEEPVPLRRLNPSIPRDLETICLKCLEKEPGKRYGSAFAMAADLRRFLNGDPIVARPVGPAERAVKWVRRRPVIAALSAAVVVMGLLGLSGIIWQWREAVAARVDAQDKARIARENEGAARREAEFANRRLYGVQMNVVQRAWEDWGPQVFLRTLDEQRPENQKDVDRRGFEWSYWRRRHATGHRTFEGHTGVVAGVAFRPDGSRLASGSWDQTVIVWDPATGRETLTLRGHKVWVRSVAFSPDGRRIASAGGQLGRAGEVKLWDAATGRELVKCGGPLEDVWSVAFSPDGRWLASAGGRDQGRGEVKVWDAATGRERLALAGHAGTVEGVAFGPDGRRIATAGRDRTVKVWDAHDGRTIRTLAGHAGAVACVAFSPDGKRLASAGADRAVKVWDADTGQEALTLRGHGNAVVSVAFSPDGRRIASAGQDRTVKVWDVGAGQEMLTLRGHAEGVYGVAFGPDGSRVASVGADKTVKVWDAVKGQETLTLAGHTLWVNRLAFSPDGDRLASAGEDATVKVWDLATGREVLTYKGHKGPSRAAAFSPDGRRVASAGSDGTVKVWDAATGEEVPASPINNRGAFECLAFSPDGRRVAFAGYKLQDWTVRVWDTATGRESLTLTGRTGPVFCLAFSPDGSRIAWPSVEGGTVKVWDAATGREILATRVDMDHSISSLAFSPDGRRIASASYDKTAKVWDLATGEDTLTLRGHTELVNGVAFGPDGRRVASASFDKTVKVWDAATGQETLTLKGHAEPAWSVAFSPDGCRIVSADRRGTLKVWDARPLDDDLAGSVPDRVAPVPGDRKIILNGHSKRVNKLVYTPEGRTLVTASDDTTIRLWDTKTGRERAALRGHSAPVLALAIAPDGRTIASGSGDWRNPRQPGELKLWDAASGVCVADLPGHAGPIPALAFSPDGRTLASSSADVKLWDVARHAERAPLDVGWGAWVNGLAISPDGKTLASSHAATVRLWDLATRKMVAELVGHNAEINGLAISPDGRTLATASCDQTAKLWDLPSHRLRTTIRHHSGMVRDVAFSPDGKTLAIGVYDGTVKLWDPDADRAIASDRVPGGCSMSVAISPDGKTVASAHSPSVVLWRFADFP